MKNLSLTGLTSVPLRNFPKDKSFPIAASASIPEENFSKLVG